LGLPLNAQNLELEKSVVHPLNWTQGQSKINCVHEGVQDGTDKKKL